MNKKPLISVHNLSVTFQQGQEKVKAVQDISFDIHQGKTTAIVGESGSGKSVTALSLLNLNPEISCKTTGEIFYNTQNILTLNHQQLESIRGAKISMIFQEPMTSLNPLHRIEEQIAEAIDLHQNLSKIEMNKRIDELMMLVGLPDIAQKKKAYPHELSGGQRQRIMIAMALANNPDLLIADEPTTALDVTIQRQILDLLKDLQAKFGMAILIISHDMGVVKYMADDICVMQKGQIVEQNTAKTLLSNPKHSYTIKLLSSKPKGKANSLPAHAKSLIQAKKLSVTFHQRSGFFGQKISSFTAVNDASFDLKQGETLGIVGESGSGKTSLGFALLRLLSSTGQIIYEGKPIHLWNQKQMRPLREDMQIVFQDPYSSLSPRMTIEDIIREGLDIHHKNLTKDEKKQAVLDVLKDVQLDETCLNRYPHEFSGGQRQRIAIARALILKPKLIVLDEPTSALDLTIQAQIIALLKELQLKYQLSYLFISHDLEVIRVMANRILVMKDGKIIESGDSESIFNAPQNEYTKTLINSKL